MGRIYGPPGLGSAQTVSKCMKTTFKKRFDRAKKKVSSLAKNEERKREDILSVLFGESKRTKTVCGELKKSRVAMLLALVGLRKTGREWFM